MSNIVDIASKYVGQVEKKGNAGFKDAAFEKQMRAAGFYTGAPWCGFFCELVWREAGQDASIITGSAVQTMKNAAKAKNWHIDPVPGAVVIYRSFKDGVAQSTGHMGIVTSVHGDTYSTIEGNTSAAGSREGTIVSKRFGKEKRWHEKNGLCLMGFIHPK